jgi:hypothetical protein
VVLVEQVGLVRYDRAGNPRGEPSPFPARGLTRSVAGTLAGEVVCWDGGELVWFRDGVVGDRRAMPAECVAISRSGAAAVVVDADPRVLDLATGAEVPLEPRRHRLHALRAEGSSRTRLPEAQRAALGAAWALGDLDERSTAVAAVLDGADGQPWAGLRAVIAARAAWSEAIGRARSMDELRAAYADTRAIDEAATEIEARYPAAERYGMRVIPRDARLALVPYGTVREVPAGLVGEPSRDGSGPSRGGAPGSRTRSSCRTPRWRPCRRRGWSRNCRRGCSPRW